MKVIHSKIFKVSAASEVFQSMSTECLKLLKWMTMVKAQYPRPKSVPIPMLLPIDTKARRELWVEDDKSSFNDQRLTSQQAINRMYWPISTPKMTCSRTSLDPLLSVICTKRIISHWLLPNWRSILKQLQAQDQICEEEIRAHRRHRH